MKLSELEKGQRALVDKINLKDELKERFFSMGLSLGVTVKICRKTIGNDSLHVKLDCSTCLALSRDEAKLIDVIPISSEGCDTSKNIDEECCDAIDCENNNN